jgi:uncharacterized protein YeaO (DUF488 family)
MTNGNHDKQIAEIREMLRMAAAQTAENTKQIARFSKQFREELRASRSEHDREMKEIRVLFKAMIKRIAA